MLNVHQALTALLLAAFMLATPLQAADESATQAQLQELRAALADGYAQRDYKGVDLAIKGFSAAGQKSAVLDETIRVAQLEAAMQLLGPMQRNQLETCGLYASAKAGSADALQKLVTTAETKLSGPVKPYTEPNAYVQNQKLMLEACRVSNALEALKMLQYKDAATLARAWLSGANGDLSDMINIDAQRLTRTCTECLLAGDREAGLKELEEFVVNPAVPLKMRITVCVLMTRKNAPGAAFQAVLNAAPADVEKRFVDKIPQLVDALDRTTDTNTAVNLLTTTMQLKLGDTVMKKFEDYAQNRANDNAKQTLQMYLHMQQPAPVQLPSKPLPPPADGKGEF